MATALGWNDLKPECLTLNTFLEHFFHFSGVVTCSGCHCSGRLEETGSNVEL